MVRNRRLAIARQKDREEAALEDQVVPLKRQKGAPDGGVAEIEHGGERSAGTRRGAGKRQQCDRYAGDDAERELQIARAPIEQRRELVKRNGLLAQEADEYVHWQ